MRQAGPAPVATTKTLETILERQQKHGNMGHSNKRQ